MEPRAGFEPAACGLQGPRNLQRVSSTSSNREIDWDGFKRYVFAEHSQRHARDLLLYASKYGQSLTNGDLSPLLRLSPSKRRHALMGLSALSKYLGIYNEFKKLREKYGIKWVANNSMPKMLLDQNGFTNMLLKAKKIIRILDPWEEVILFLALSGLRVEESLNCIRIFHEQGAKNYLNEELGVLEHYRFPETFIRKTKHAYITVIDDYMLDLLENAEPVSYDKLRSYFRRRSRSKCGFHLFRKIWATYMHRQRIDTEIIDLLQGRIPKTIFSRYYYRPDLKPLLDNIRTELPSLRKILMV